MRYSKKAPKGVESFARDLTTTCKWKNTDRAGSFP